jgi:hypothetical protein
MNQLDAVRSLKQFKARMCDCGNPICFGTLTSQDVDWLVRVYESTRSQVRAIEATREKGRTLGAGSRP